MRNEQVNIMTPKWMKLESFVFHSGLSTFKNRDFQTILQVQFDIDLLTSNVCSKTHSNSTVDAI